MSEPLLPELGMSSGLFSFKGFTHEFPCFRIHIAVALSSAYFRRIVFVLVKYHQPVSSCTLRFDHIHRRETYIIKSSIKRLKVAKSSQRSDYGGR